MKDHGLWWRLTEGGLAELFAPRLFTDEGRSSLLLLNQLADLPGLLEHQIAFQEGVFKLEERRGVQT